MNWLDGCPECVTNTELPQRQMHAEGEWRTYYRCSSCGHEWMTAWRDE